MSSLVHAKSHHLTLFMIEKQVRTRWSRAKQGDGSPQRARKHGKSGSDSKAVNRQWIKTYSRVIAEWTSERAGWRGWRRRDEIAEMLSLCIECLGLINGASVAEARLQTSVNADQHKRRSSLEKSQPLDTTRGMPRRSPMLRLISRWYHDQARAISKGYELSFQVLLWVQFSGNAL